MLVVAECSQKREGDKTTAEKNNARRQAYEREDKQKGMKLVRTIFNNDSLSPQDKVNRLFEISGDGLKLDFGNCGKSYLSEWTDMCSISKRRCTYSVFTLREVPDPARRCNKYKDIADYCYARLRTFCRETIILLSKEGVSAIKPKRFYPLKAVIESYQSVEEGEAQAADKIEDAEEKRKAEEAIKYVTSGRVHRAYHKVAASYTGYARADFYRYVREGAIALLHVYNDLKAVLGTEMEGIEILGLTFPKAGKIAQILYECFPSDPRQPLKSGQL